MIHRKEDARTRRKVYQYNVQYASCYYDGTSRLGHLSRSSSEHVYSFKYVLGYRSYLLLTGWQKSVLEIHMLLTEILLSLDSVSLT